MVASVEARGKHLLIHLDDGHTVHVHLGMTGLWHVYATGERWRRPGFTARLVIDVKDAQAVCFGAPVVEVLETRTLPLQPSLKALGPDLTVPGVDVDEVLVRLAGCDGEIGAVLLDQRVASGIGNIWRSETLHACRVSPFATLEELDDRTRRRLYETASWLLRGGREGRHAVYRRARLPCERCGTPIARAMQAGRAVYWCPSCQK
jgi:endonuclease-8